MTNNQTRLTFETSNSEAITLAKKNKVMKKQINIEAAINEVKSVCGHFAEKIERVPANNQIIVHIDQNKDGYKTLPQMANFNMVSASVAQNRVLSFGLQPSTYAIGVYEPKRGKFTL